MRRCFETQSCGCLLHRAPQARSQLPERGGERGRRLCAACSRQKDTARPCAAKPAAIWTHTHWLYSVQEGLLG